MTKKHFTQLAQALKDTGASNDTIEAVASVCAQFNPSFSRTRFKEACGFEYVTRVTN